MAKLQVRVSVMCPNCGHAVPLKQQQGPTMTCVRCETVTPLRRVDKPKRPKDAPTREYDDGDLIYVCNREWFQTTYGDWWEVIWVMTGCGRLPS